MKLMRKQCLGIERKVLFSFSWIHLELLFVAMGIRHKSTNLMVACTWLNDLTHLRPT